MGDLGGLPKELFEYFLYSYHRYKWCIEIKKNLVLFDIHDKLIRYKFGKIETSIQYRKKRGDDINKINRELINDKNAVFGFSYLAKVLNEYRYIMENRLYTTQKDSKKYLYLLTVYNPCSDYPRNKKTGELVDLTPYAKENREFFNGLVKYLCEVTGGEVVEVYPKKEDKDLKKYEIWQAEEIDKKGFKALSERKEEYEEQERKKRFRKKFGIFGRLIP